MRGPDDLIRQVGERTGWRGNRRSEIGVSCGSNAGAPSAFRNRHHSY